MPAMSAALNNEDSSIASRWPGQLAAVDLGSNSFRLEIGQWHQERYRRIDYLKETVRLGAGLDENAFLTEEATQRGLACLARFAKRLQGFAPSQVRAVATQTLREARNRDAFLARAREPFAPAHWVEALGSSGTVGAVSQLLAASAVTDGRITPSGLRWLMEQCLRAGRVDRLVLTGLKDERRPVIAGGLAILYTLAMHFGIDQLLPARGALRQGVIFDLDERRLAATHEAEGHDIRDASVRELQRRFMVDVEQAERVWAVAEALY